MEYKLTHTCIKVMDLEKSLKFYSEALGFHELRRMEFPEHGFTIVFIGDKNGYNQLELTYHHDNKHEPYDLGNGLSHIGVLTDDLRGSWERHKEMGYNVSDIMGLPGRPPKFYFIKDPDGYEIEIVGTN